MSLQNLRRELNKGGILPSELRFSEGDYLKAMCEAGRQSVDPKTPPKTFCGIPIHVNPELGDGVVVIYSNGQKHSFRF